MIDNSNIAIVFIEIGCNLQLVRIFDKDNVMLKQDYCNVDYIPKMVLDNNVNKVYITAGNQYTKAIGDEIISKAASKYNFKTIPEVIYG